MKTKKDRVDYIRRLTANNFALIDVLDSRWNFMIHSILNISPNMSYIAIEKFLFDNDIKLGEDNGNALAILLPKDDTIEYLKTFIDSLGLKQINSFTIEKIEFLGMSYQLTLYGVVRNNNF